MVFAQQRAWSAAAAAVPARDLAPMPGTQAWIRPGSTARRCSPSCRPPACPGAEAPAATPAARRRRGPGVPRRGGLARARRRLDRRHHHAGPARAARLPRPASCRWRRWRRARRPGHRPLSGCSTPTAPWCGTTRGATRARRLGARRPAAAHRRRHAARPPRRRWLRSRRHAAVGAQLGRRALARHLASDEAPSAAGVARRVGLRRGRPPLLLFLGTADAILLACSTRALAAPVDYLHRKALDPSRPRAGAAAGWAPWALLTRHLRRQRAPGGRRAACRGPQVGDRRPRAGGHHLDRCAGPHRRVQPAAGRCSAPPRRGAGPLGDGETIVPPRHRAAATRRRSARCAKAARRRRWGAAPR